MKSDRISRPSRKDFDSLRYLLIKLGEEVPVKVKNGGCTSMHIILDGEPWPEMFGNLKALIESYPNTFIHSTGKELCVG